MMAVICAGFASRYIYPEESVSDMLILCNANRRAESGVINAGRIVFNHFF